MRKIYLYVLFVLFLFIPISVKAYGISNYYVDVKVLDNGDVSVKEIFKLEGNFNGFERIINYKNNNSIVFDPTSPIFSGSSIHNGTDLILNSIKGIDNNISFDSINSSGDIFVMVSDAQKGDYGKYIERDNMNGKSYLIYNPSRKEKAFYIEYTIKNLSILHNDIGELGWSFFGTELNEAIGNFEMHINIPNNKNEIRAWAHGPLWGNINIVDKNNIIFTVDNLDSNNALDIRLAFDKEVLKSASKKTYVDALNKIIDYETVLADEANLKREETKIFLENEAKEIVEYTKKTEDRSDYETALYKVEILPEGKVKSELSEELIQLVPKIEKKENKIKIIYLSLLGAWLVGFIYLIYYTYNKYDKEYKSDFNGKYYRDFPASYGPEIVGYLINRKISNNDLSAAIANLIFKKIIFCQEIKGDYQFTLNKEITSISKSDMKLIDFLFDGTDDDLTLLSSLKKRAKKNYESFLKKYTAWHSASTDEAVKMNFFEINGVPKVFGFLYTLLGFYISLIAIKYLKSFPFIIIFLCIIGLVYLLCYTKRSVNGNNDYRKWIGLRNYMQDFGRMDTKDLPELILWEKYLVYAVSLGCADKLAKTMKIKVKELEENGYTITDTLFDYHYINMMSSFNRTINNTVSSSISTANQAHQAAIAASSSSSGGGFGGGFSGGGGSFGGGGGGGRF